MPNNSQVFGFYLDDIKKIKKDSVPCEKGRLDWYCKDILGLYTLVGESRYEQYTIEGAKHLQLPLKVWVELVKKFLLPVIQKVEIFTGY